MASAIGTVVSQKYTKYGEYNQNAAYAGFNYHDEYYPFILQFKTPSFTGKTTSLDFNLSMSDGSRNEVRSSKVNLRYAILSSDANYNKYFTTKAVEDENQITSGTLTITELTSDWQSKKLNIAVNGLAGDTTYYLILWGDNSGGYGQDYATVNTPSNHSVTLWYYPNHTVRVHHVLHNVGGGLTIFNTVETSVTENSKFTPTTIALPSGNVANTAENSNYQYWTNGYGTKLGSGTTGVDPITVTQSLVVEIYYPLRTYKLTISQDASSTISVKKSEVVLSNGATIAHGDVLTIVFGADTGYELDIHTVNGSTFASGDTHTVTGDVLVVSTASPLGLVYIDNGTGWDAYQVYIDNGTSWDLYIPYIDNGANWDICS